MSGNAGLSCKELVEIVTDYLEGTLPPSARARFEEHLTECEGCRIHLDQIRTVVALTGRLTEETIPAGARDRLLAAFRSWNAG